MAEQPEPQDPREPARTGAPVSAHRSPRVARSTRERFATLTDGEVLKLATIGERLEARTYDTIIVVVGVVAAAIPMLYSVLWDFAEPDTEPPWWLDDLWLALFLPVLLYEFVTTAVRGRSLGKKICAIQVVRCDDGRVPGMARSLVRWVVPHAAIGLGIGAEVAEWGPEPMFLTSLSGGLSSLGWWLLVYASARWDQNRRGWHDKAAGTVVIQT